MLFREIGIFLFELEGVRNVRLAIKVKRVSLKIVWLVVKATRLESMLVFE